MTISSTPWLPAGWWRWLWQRTGGRGTGPGWQWGARPRPGPRPGWSWSGWREPWTERRRTTTRNTSWTSEGGQEGGIYDKILMFWCSEQFNHLSMKFPCRRCCRGLHQGIPVRPGPVAGWSYQDWGQPRPAGAWRGSSPGSSCSHGLSVLLMWAVSDLH